MKKTFTLFIFTTFSLSSLAYIPTLHSLFRNGENPSLGSNTLVVSLKVKKTTTESDGPVVTEESLKYLVNNQREEYPRLLQLRYAGGKTDSSSLYKMDTFPFYKLERLVKNQEQFDKKLFYSLVAIFLGNNGTFMVDLLNSQGFSIPKNKELINADKARLLRDYKAYLTQIKEANGEEIEMMNPLRPEGPEKKEQVKLVMKKPFLKEDGLVKRFKNGDHFNWVVEQEKLFISFSHDHQLEELNFEASSGSYKVSFGRFLLFGASLEFPENITIHHPSGDVYEIRFGKVSQISDNESSYRRRMTRYQKQIKENNITPPAQNSLFTL